MKLDKKRTTIINKFENLKNNYKSFENLMDYDLDVKLDNFLKEFKSDTAELMDENKKLRIGIVGQIKVGKSSFLNSLLFNSKSILPKAATPMTAALTVISYSDSPRAEVNFYNKNDWETIVNKGKEYNRVLNEYKNNFKKEINKNKNNNEFSMSKEQIIKNAELKMTDDIISSKELLDMVKKNNIKVENHFDETKIIKSKNTKDLVGLLDEYVGANGKFTPLVKDTKLFIPNENIKNIEIVDTPGMNDPILSRGNLTRKNLGKCDVIFLLSSASQFMSASDVQLMTRYIPSKGIKNVILLASKYDSTLLGLNQYDSFKKAAVHLFNNLESQAESSIMPIIKDNPDNSTLNNLKNSLPPTFISSMLYDIGNHFNNLNESEKHILERLKSTFENDEFNKENLKYRSNIIDIKEKKLPPIQKNKEKIINERLEDILDAQLKEFIKVLSETKEEVELNKERLENSDIQELNKKGKFISENINNISEDIKLIFEEKKTQIEKQFSIFISDIKISAQKYKKISVKKGQDVKTYQVSSSKWYNPFSWGSTETKRNVIDYNYINTLEVVERLEDFILNSEKEIKKTIINIVDLEKFKKQLIKTVIENFDLGNENFNKNEILIPIRKELSKISIPNVNIDVSKYIKNINSEFSGMVKDDNINELKRLQAESIRNVINDMESIVNNKSKEIANSFKVAGNNFIDNVLKDSKDKLDETKQQISQKEKYLGEYSKLNKTLADDINYLKTLYGGNN
jgi:hypothetical protein